MVFEFGVRQAGFGVVLHPFHAARCEVGGGADAGCFGEDFEGDVGDFECEGRVVFMPAT